MRRGTRNRAGLNTFFLTVRDLADRVIRKDTMFTKSAKLIGAALAAALLVPVASVEAQAHDRGHDRGWHDDHYRGGHYREGRWYREALGPPRPLGSPPLSPGVPLGMAPPSPRAHLPLIARADC
jgi:hypothetical protein